jgi:hypothetical protein
VGSAGHAVTVARRVASTGLRAGSVMPFVVLVVLVKS